MRAGFSSCGARAQLLCGMWYLPTPELEPTPPVLAGGFLTTAPPGKPPSGKVLNVFRLKCAFVLGQVCCCLITGLKVCSKGSLVSKESLESEMQK